MLIGEEERKKLSDRFERDMKDEVEIVLVLPDDTSDEYSEFDMAFLSELAEICSKIKVSKESIGSSFAKDHDVERAPTIFIAPDRYSLRYVGAPAGEEAWGFLETIVMASTGDSGLAEETRKAIVDLKDERVLKTFTTLMCPYCPMQAVLANRFAVESPDKIRADVIDAQMAEELTEGYKVSAVPFTAMDGKLLSVGVQKEDKFLSDILEGPKED